MPAWKVSRRMISFGICMVVLLGTAVSVAYCEVLFQRHRAEKLIELLSDVAPGRTSKEVVLKQLQYESFHPGGSKACANDASRSCDQFEFTNKWLSSLHVSPSKYVWVTLDYRDGFVVSKSVQFAEEPRISAVTRQLLHADEPSFGDSVVLKRRVIVNIVSAGNAIVKIYDNENVSTEQRQKDWRVDLSCLSKLGACRDPRVVLPSAF
jgi:hypothetical protein